jgi:hypothetical protein
MKQICSEIVIGLKKKAVYFNHTCRYIDGVLSVNKHNFQSYVLLTCPGKQEIKDTTKSDISASYLNILLDIDSNGRLKTLYEKHHDFNFSIVDSSFLCSNIPVYDVYIPQLIR